MGKNLRKRQVPQKVELSDSVSKIENTNGSETVKERNKRKAKPSKFESIGSKTDKTSGSDVSDADSSGDHFEGNKKSSKNYPRKSVKSTGKSTANESSEEEEVIPENGTNEQISGDSKVKKAKPFVGKSQDDGAKSSSKRGRKGKSEKDKPVTKSSNKPSDCDVEFSDQESSGAPYIQSLCETLEKESAQDKETSEESESNPPIAIAIKSKPSAKKRKNDQLEGKKAKRSRKTESTQEIKKSSRLKTVKKRDSATGAQSNKDDSATPAQRTSDRNKSKKDEKSETAANDETSDSESEESPMKSGKKDKFRFPCHKCKAVFCKTHDLYDHTCEGKRLKGFACEFCDKIYQTRSIYINHRIIHSKKKPYKCGLCGKKSSSQSNHLYHVKKFHPKSNPFPCEFPPCTKSFLLRKQQVAHHKMHKKYICVYCDEEFDKNSTLVSHKQNEHDVFF